MITIKLQILPIVTRTRIGIAFRYGNEKVQGSKIERHHNPPTNLQAF